ncbi:hypothetical protein PIB30_015608 [Stylosanthes scabra]|uniref:Uncharacterized protein n=1 Tax=Stylosanthes scabra TaxID=79078 RepID=A0ABU6R7D2_9FABA|nr:hypothetical protein [Stylosanthes scabra]
MPKAILGNPERARKSIVTMAGRNKTLANLCQYMVANPQGPIVVGPSGGQTSSSVPEGGGSSTAGGATNARPEVSSSIREEGPEQQVEIVPPSPLGKGPTTRLCLSKRGRGRRRVLDATSVRWTGLLMPRLTSRTTSWVPVLVRPCRTMIRWRAFVGLNGRCSPQTAPMY